MTITVLDPTVAAPADSRQPAPRLPTLAGATVGFISNGKEGKAGFLAHLDRLLREHFSVADVVHLGKFNYRAPAEPDIIDAAREWDLAVTGLGD